MTCVALGQKKHSRSSLGSCRFVSVLNIFPGHCNGLEVAALGMKLQSPLYLTHLFPSTVKEQIFSQLVFTSVIILSIVRSALYSPLLAVYLLCSANITVSDPTFALSPFFIQLKVHKSCICFQTAGLSSAAAQPFTWRPNSFELRALPWLPTYSMHSAVVCKAQPNKIIHCWCYLISFPISPFYPKRLYSQSYTWQIHAGSELFYALGHFASISCCLTMPEHCPSALTIRVLVGLS